MTKVFINGNQGTTGLRLAERLRARKDIDILDIPYSDRKNSAVIKEFISSSDITFLCLPDAAAIEAVSLCENPDVRFVDASTAHRTNPDWVYGFPELSQENRKKIAGGKRIAVPGCHASGFVSLIYPLISQGILPRDYPVCCTSVTGYSGGGKSMIADYTAKKSHFLDSPRQYGLSQEHKHLKEMEYITGLAKKPLFSPIVSNFYSGMAVSIPLHAEMLIGKHTPNTVREALADFYAGQRLIRVAPDGKAFDDGFVPANILSGKDSMNIYALGCDERILLISVFDNLGKGASGAAVQCMNIMTGADESEGLLL